HPRSSLFSYTTLFRSTVIFYLLLCIPSTMQRSVPQIRYKLVVQQIFAAPLCSFGQLRRKHLTHSFQPLLLALHLLTQWLENSNRSEEHTSELQSRFDI